MGYIRDVERELREMLADLPPEKAEPIVRFVKAKVYESYKNGRNGKAPEAKPEAPDEVNRTPEAKPCRARRVPTKGKFKRR